MIKNYLLITFRSMMKNKLFIFINVIGMGLAIAHTIVGYFAYEHDANFDANHQNREQIYRVTSLRSFQDEITRYGFAPFPLGQVVDKTFQDVNKSARYYHSYSNFKREADLFPAHLNYVDPDFFTMFSFDFIAGNGSGLDQSSVVVSEEMAHKLFGSPDEALGKTIAQIYGNDQKELKITGVYREQPMNSSFYRKGGSSYTNFENYKNEHRSVAEDDWTDMNTLFVQIDDPSRLGVVRDQLQGFLENNNKVREDFQIDEYTLDPLTTMAHVDRAEDARNATFEAPPISAIIGSMVMGILILLIACFNLTNTSIAISSRRLKEIGLRKVMGGLRIQLIIQYIGETLVICFLALLVGLALGDILVGAWNLMWEYMQLSPRYLDNLQFIVFMAIVLILTALLAGGYPAFYISRFEPVSILKGKLKFGGTNYFTRTLLALQFAISLIAIISATGFIQNAKYQQEYDLGFNATGSIVAWLEDERETEMFKNALLSNPEILSISGATSGIFSNRNHDPVKSESKQVEVDIIQVGDNYLNTLDLTLLKGRDFRKDSETDRKESVIVTEKMAKMFGWEDPIGKEVIWRDTARYYVVGVIKDVYTSGLWRELEPMMIRYALPSDYNQVVVKAESGKLTAINEYMGEKWKELFPNRVYNGQMLTESIHEMLEVNVNIVYMFSFIGAVALMLSATGLFSLVSLNIIKRMKEIGVRKVLGASVASIATKINTEFVIILVVASVLGSALSFLLINSLMGSIWRYYQSLNIWSFTASIIALFAISFSTIGYKVLSAASMNPVNTLKDE